MRFHTLRATFQRLVASAGLIGAAGRVVAGGCCPGIDPIELTRTIDPREPSWVDLVASCRADDRSCTKLCRQFVPGSTPDEPDRMAAILECFIVDRERGATDVHVSYYIPEDCSAGRRPPGLVAAPAAPGLGGWLAAVAHLEAASVPAFVLLADDLIRAGAPRPLVAASVAAAGDEVRHAGTMRALARAAGAEPAPVRLVATAPRDLFALALDNAVEGCVREAFAALCATHQARAAADPALRRAFATIAVDETRHAALAFAIDGWLMARLAPAARAAVTAARRAAFAELAAGLAVDDAVTALAGWPPPAVAARLLSGSRTLLAA